MSIHKKTVERYVEVGRGGPYGREGPYGKDRKVKQPARTIDWFTQASIRSLLYGYHRKSEFFKFV